MDPFVTESMLKQHFGKLTEEFNKGIDAIRE
jgi:hypothetical protein